MSGSVAAPLYLYVQEYYQLAHKELNNNCHRQLVTTDN
jgi:hypothetical protein